MKQSTIFLLLIIVFNSCSQTKVQHDYLIADINVIDVRDGNIITNRWIGIDSNRITKIYSKKVIPSESTITVKGDSKFLIPGLWDMHSHYHRTYNESAPFYIANGVIGLRDMHGDMVIINWIREDMKSDKFVGPVIFSSGAVINDYFAPLSEVSTDIATDSVTAVEIVIKQKAEGVDFLKIYSHLNREAYFAIAKQTKKMNLDFCGHIPESISAFEAILSGQKSIEHNLGLLEATSTGSDTIIEYIQSKRTPKPIVPSWRAKFYDFLIESHSEVLFDSLVNELANSNTWLCPTMVAIEGIAYQAEDSFRNDYRNKYIPQEILDYLVNSFNNSDTAMVSAMRRRYEFEKSLLKKMINGGVKFLAGTDYICVHVYPGFSLHDELKIFNEAGFSTLQALQTATLNPAIYLNKLADYGTVEESKVASLVILNSNPLQNIENTKDIESVFLGGKYFSKCDIDSLLNTPVY
ncbi:amidohydrolase family protein [Bacteroidota bacterium]